MQPESISLYFKDGGSDKVYHAQLSPKDGGFMVTAQNGPRGGTLVARNKTPAPVDYAKAKKAYDSLVREKVGKGYSMGEAGTVFTQTDLEERFTGIVPQLLNPITDDESETYLRDSNWILQEKFDGHRRLLQAQPAVLTGINRKGLAVALPVPVAALFEPLRATLAPVVDGELMGDVYGIFDILEANGNDLRGLSVDARLAELEKLQVLMGDTKGAVVFIRTARTEAEKRTLLTFLKDNKFEGGVFKRLTAKYVPGRPNSGGDQLKRVFRYRASFIVAKVSATKRSVSLDVLDAAGLRVNVKNVTIPANYPIPVMGQIADVEYLCAYIGGGLRQPQWKGVRDDIDLSACTSAQLHFKAAIEDEDDETTV